jgi:hypothetical protein
MVNGAKMIPRNGEKSPLVHDSLDEKMDYVQHVTPGALRASQL